METELDLELKRLVLGTNEQRRRVGQAVYHLYRTLVFWNDKGRPFLEIVRAWSAGGAAIFDALAGTLRELQVFEEDRPLRGWLSEVFLDLAADLERGDHRLWPFLRGLEGRFPALTRMMQEERTGSRIHDLELARSLTRAFETAARTDRAGLVSTLRGAAAL